MAANRPHGKREPTAPGSDAVAGEPAPDDRLPVPAETRRRVERAERDDRSGVDPERLDERERRQSATRKPAGPRGRRLTEDDVVIETSSADDAAPTDPQ